MKIDPRNAPSDGDAITADDNDVHFDNDVDSAVVDAGSVVAEDRVDAVDATDAADAADPVNAVDAADSANTVDAIDAVDLTANDAMNIIEDGQSQDTGVFEPRSSKIQQNAETV